MNDSLLGFFCGFGFFMLIEPLYVNFIYLSNIDLFLDIVLFKKKRDKLIKHIKDNY